MKKLILLISLTTSLVLSGCSSMMKNSMSFAIKGQNKSYIYKNTWPECANFKINPILKYNDLSDSCKVSPEGYVPEQIIIEYAPWLTYKEQIKKGYGVPEELRYGGGEEAAKKRLAIMAAQQEGVAKIPTAAWKRIVLTPLKDIEKYKYQVPEGKGNRSRGKNIHYIISLNPDGSYSIETKLYWVQKYQLNWN